MGIKVNSNAESGEFDIDIMKFNDTDYVYIIGSGVDIGVLNIGARYEGGLTEISENSSAKNDVLTLTAGIEFKLVFLSAEI